MLKQQVIPLSLIISLTLSAPVFARGGHGMGMDSERMAEFIAQYDSNQDGTVTAEEIQAARAAEFQQADTNANGILELRELQADMESKHAEQQATHFAQIDTDENSQLSAEEFQNAHSGQDTGIAATLFGLADQDKNGTLTQEEFATLRSPEGRMWHHFAQLDSDGDGVISIVEYTAAKTANRGREFGGRGGF
jgi:Ca2+-binding EF-hand superfamily protein